MSFRSPSPRAHQNWSTLSDRGRFGALAWAARYLTQRPALVRSLGEGVLRVGHGLRHQRPPGRRRGVYVDEPALLVVVDRKIPKARAASRAPGALVPRWVELRLPVGRRRILVALPTDVQEGRKLPRAQARQTQGIRARPAGPGSKVDGVACALVRRSGKLYILGCHHVILRSLVTPGATPDLAAQIFDVPSAASEKLLGIPSDAAVFGPGVPASLDAALAQVEPAAIPIVSSPTFWSARPNSWARTLDDVLDAAAGGFNLFSRGGKMIALKLVGHFFNQPVGYGGGTSVEIAEVLVLVVADSSQPAPMAGDSGATVMAGNGMLVGMHIAGIPNEGKGYAIPSYQLLDGPAFDPPVTLA